MDRAYDVFEILPDGSPLSRATVTGLETAIATVTGLETAIRALKELATQTPNEVRIMHLPDQAIIATMNVREE
jgi:hypothetical protein